MSTIDIYSVIRQAKVQGLKAQDVVDTVNEFINRYRDTMVYDPDSYYEVCLYRDTEKGICCISGTAGETDSISEDGDFIGDRQYMKTLDYLEPGKDAVSLITCFPEIESKKISGPVRYCYPDGRLAGVEFYQYRNNIDEESKIRKEQCIWFSPDGKQISMHEFDVLFNQVLKAVELTDYIYAPRKYQYRELATSFIINLKKYNDLSLFMAFRDSVASWPDEKLRILEEKIREEYPTGEEYGILEEKIQRYLYGFCDHQKLSSEISQDFFKYISENVINSEHCEVHESHLNGQKICKYGDFQYEQVGCYEISSKYKYVEVWQDGIKSSAGFVTDTSYGEQQIGPSVTFYPNGEIYRIAYYRYAGNSLETDVANVRYFDQNGRLSTLSIAHKQFQEQWTAVRKEAEKKGQFDRKQITETYRRLCSKCSVDILHHRHGKK